MKIINQENVYALSKIKIQTSLKMQFKRIYAIFIHKFFMQSYDTCTSSLPVITIILNTITTSFQP